MSSSILPPGSKESSYKGAWASTAPYVAPPLIASSAIIPVFRDLVTKSALQKGESPPRLTFSAGMKEGLKAAPTVAFIIGSQMFIQGAVEKRLIAESGSGTIFHSLASSAVVGAGSAPFLAIFNGQTMGWTIEETLLRLTSRQICAISIQETSFIVGISFADRIAPLVKRRFGESQAVDYTAAFISGTMGSLAGHPCNTALTRWQSGLPVDLSFRQLMKGSCYRARASGCFSMAYKLGKDLVMPKVPASE